MAEEKTVYVPGYENDIFISYAQVNDKPLPGAKTGWVSELVRLLKIRLNEKLGRANSYFIWMDNKALRRNELVTPDIDHQLRHSATFVFILSEGYQASQWCQLELTTFLQMAPSGTLFMVEYEPIEEKPLETQELLGYRFWQRDEITERSSTLGMPIVQPTDVNYYTALDQLATDLAKKLKQLKAEASPGRM